MSDIYTSTKDAKFHKDELLQIQPVTQHFV